MPIAAPRRLAAPLVAVVVRPLQAFLRLEAASGILLLASAVAALVLANTGASTAYRAALDLPITFGLGPLRARFTAAALINDGLMTIFFFVVGLEIKRELVLGELRTFRQAALPAIAAVGGMLVPAGIYLALNAGGPGQAGWGIPMATDIAFCIGVLTLLRSRVPYALVVFVTALAIFDDIGGILVIALFYGTGLNLAWLAGAAAILATAVAMSRARVGSGIAYGACGALLWYALHHAGIHGTIAGVAVGLCVPAHARSRSGALPEGPDGGESPLAGLVQLLHPWVAFGIMPLFALANSGVDLRAIAGPQLTSPVAIGTAVALLAGKQIGVFTFTWAAVRLGAAPMPGDVPLSKLLGVATVSGIGFTVALFIAALAFPGRPDLLDQAKVGILAGSLVAGLCGAAILWLGAPVPRPALPGSPDEPFVPRAGPRPPVEDEGRSQG